MKRKNYENPYSQTVVTRLRHTILAGSISKTQSAAGVPEDTPIVETSPLPPGVSYD